jgi:hypothetical protein
MKHKYKIISAVLAVLSVGAFCAGAFYLHPVAGYFATGIGLFAFSYCYAKAAKEL